MSRIGTKLIPKDNTISVSLQGDQIMVSGPKGKLHLVKPENITLKINEKDIQVESTESVGNKSIHGLFRSLLSNAIVGVATPWTKSLELIGVGYRAQTTGAELVLSLGFSHPVKVQAPDGVTFQVAESIITVSGVDKYAVGEVAATIRRIKKPEPYKGKGIRYKGEYIRKKLGKAAKAVGASGTK